MIVTMTTATKNGVHKWGISQGKPWLNMMPSHFPQTGWLRLAVWYQVSCTVWICMDCSLEYPSIGHVMTLLATGNGPRKQRWKHKQLQYSKLFNIGGSSSEPDVWQGFPNLDRTYVALGFHESFS